jgi:hypothetical protein
MSTTDGGAPQASGYTTAEISQLVDLLDRDPIFELVADTYADALQSGGGLEDVITALRNEALR